MSSRWRRSHAGLRRGGALGLGAVVLTWAVLLVVTPYLAAHSHEQRGRSGTLLAAGVYVVGSLVCHQRPERSFALWDVQMPVCARCSGLYAGAPLGLVGTWYGRRGRTGVRAEAAGRRARSVRSLRVILAVAAVPTALSIGAEWVGAWETSNLARMLTALPLGVSVAWVVGLAALGGVDEER